jgi:hypothetical protein
MAESNIVAGLFGMTPEMYQRQQYQQDLRQGYDLAQLDPGAAARAQLGAGIGQLGRGFAGAMGIEDPQLRMISQTNQLMQGLNLRDPQSLANAAQQASQMGNIPLAMKLIELSDVAQSNLAKMQAQQEVLQARQISQQAFQPGTPERPQMLDIQERQQMADQGTPIPENFAGTAPSYDVSRVANRLLATPAGRAEYKSILDAQEASAKTSKLAAEALSAQAKANVAAPSERVKLLKESADAEKAVIESKFTEQLQKADLLQKTANATKAAIESQFTERLQNLGLTKANWDINNLKSEISNRSAKLNLDTQMTNATVLEKLASINKMATEIPADTRKLINESVVTATTAQQSSAQFNDLANRIEGLGGYGRLSSLSEFAKSTIGAEGYETSLRQEYTRLRNTAAIKSLPPGPATDKDIQMALSGFPKDTSNSANIAQFLRGMAKLQDIDAAVSNAKTDWLAQNNGALTRATKTLVVGDFRARPGESFNELSSRIAEDVNARYSGQSREVQRQNLVSQIPTNQPSGTTSLGAPQTSILQQADAILGRR